MVKRFIEQHIDELDNPEDYTSIYFAAYNEFNNEQFAQFNTIMHDALNIDVSEYQESVLRFVLTHEIEDWLNSTEHFSMNVHQFAYLHLLNTCGMSKDEFEQFMLENKDEFDGVIISRNRQGGVSIRRVYEY